LIGLQAVSKVQACAEHEQLSGHARRVILKSAGKQHNILNREFSRDMSNRIEIAFSGFFVGGIAKSGLGQCSGGAFADMVINGKCDVAAGFSPLFAQTTDATKHIQWKAKAFPYID